MSKFIENFLYNLFYLIKYSIQYIYFSGSFYIKKNILFFKARDLTKKKETNLINIGLLAIENYKEKNNLNSSEQMNNLYNIYLYLDEKFKKLEEEKSLLKIIHEQELKKFSYKEEDKEEDKDPEESKKEEPEEEKEVIQKEPSRFSYHKSGFIAIDNRVTNNQNSSIDQEFTEEDANIINTNKNSNVNQELTEEDANNINKKNFKIINLNHVNPYQEVTFNEEKKSPLKEEQFKDKKDALAFKEAKGTIDLNKKHIEVNNKKESIHFSDINTIHSFKEVDFKENTINKEQEFKTFNESDINNPLNKFISKTTPPPEKPTKNYKAINGKAIKKVSGFVDYKKEKNKLEQEKLDSLKDL